jgi:hypothetical protein
MYEIIQGEASVVQARVNKLIACDWHFFGPLQTHMNQDGYIICIQVMTQFPTKI